jgi:hypothetical protein
MGARSLNRVQFTLERDVLRIFGRATGAATSNMTSLKGAGVASLARTGVGAHTLTLTDKWPGLLMFKATILDAGTVDDWEVIPIEELVATSKTVKFVIFKGGAAADLPTTGKILFELVLSNSTKLPKGY